MSIWENEVDPASNRREIFFDNGDTLPVRFNVSSKDIKEGKKIGNGQWGPVLEAQWLGRKIAVKKFRCNSTFDNVKLMSKEVTRMLRLRHSNVLKLIGFYLLAQEDEVLHCSMIMELMDFDLDKYIEQRREGLLSNFEGGLPLSDAEGLYIIAEIARGINHMHKRKYFHRDLKPQNVLMRKSDVSRIFHVDVKIADFGSSELMGVGYSDRKVGTLRYKAPEQFDDAVTLLPDKVDVFSFGVLCSKVLTGEEPYENRPEGTSLREHIRNGGKPTIPCYRNLPEDVIEVIKKCLARNPEDRPDFEDICGVLDPVLEEIWMKGAMVLEASACTSSVPEASIWFFLKAILLYCQNAITPCIFSHPEELDLSDGVRGHDHLVSTFEQMGLPNHYIDYLIPYEELYVRRLLGEGVDTKVYEVRWKGTVYAQKVLAYECKLKPWFEILLRLSHKNIVVFLGYSLTHSKHPGKHHFTIIMELMQLDLSALIEDSLRLGGRTSPFDEPKSRYIMKEIAEGMAYLHGKGVVHGDLKPMNVLISAWDKVDRVVKLTDFGSGDPLYCTTVYAAREILASRRHRSCRHGRGRPTETIDYKKADVYSFGMVSYEILGGYVKELRGEFAQSVLEGKRPALPTETSQDLKGLITECWENDPALRPSFSEICKFFGSRYIES